MPNPEGAGVERQTIPPVPEKPKDVKAQLGELKDSAEREKERQLNFIVSRLMTSGHVIPGHTDYDYKTRVHQMGEIDEGKASRLDTQKVEVSDQDMKAAKKLYGRLLGAGLPSDAAISLVTSFKKGLSNMSEKKIPYLLFGGYETGKLDYKISDKDIAAIKQLYEQLIGAGLPPELVAPLIGSVEFGRNYNIGPHKFVNDETGKPRFKVSSEDIGIAGRLYDRLLKSGLPPEVAGALTSSVSHGLGSMAKTEEVDGEKRFTSKVQVADSDIAAAKKWYATLKEKWEKK